MHTLVSPPDMYTSFQTFFNIQKRFARFVETQIYIKVFDFRLWKSPPGKWMNRYTLEQIFLVFNAAYIFPRRYIHLFFFKYMIVSCSFYRKLFSALAENYKLSWEECLFIEYFYAGLKIMFHSIWYICNIFRINRPLNGEFRLEFDLRFSNGCL